MAKVKKSVWPGVLFTVLVVLVILIIASPFIIDSILKVGIETAITKQLNVGSSVSRVHLDITGGSIEIKDLKINNPPGYEFKYILEANSINVKADVRSLLSDTVEVNQVNFDGIAVAIEQKVVTNNMADILKSMPKKEKVEPKQKGKNVHISSLDIRDINVKAKLLPVPGKLDTAELKISKIHLSDIGGEKTMLSDVVGRIFNEIANAIAKQGTDVMPKDLINPIKDNIGQVSERIESLKQEAKDAAEKLKGLFKKKD